MGQPWTSGRPMPRLLASIPCEDVVASLREETTFSIQQITFLLTASAWPARFDRLMVVNLWTGGEGTYKETVRILTPEGKEIVRSDSVLQATPESPAPVLIASMFRLVLAGPGVYPVEVMLDDASVHAFELHAVTVGPPAVRSPTKESRDEPA